MFTFNCFLKALGGTVWVMLMSYAPDSGKMFSFSNLELQLYKMFQFSDLNTKKRSTDDLWNTVTSRHQGWVHDIDNIKY